MRSGQWPALPRGVAAVSCRRYHFRPPFRRSCLDRPAFVPRFVFFRAVVSVVSVNQEVLVDFRFEALIPLHCID